MDQPTVFIIVCGVAFAFGCVAGLMLTYVRPPAAQPKPPLSRAALKRRDAFVARLDDILGKVDKDKDHQTRWDLTATRTNCFCIGAADYLAFSGEPADYEHKVRLQNHLHKLGSVSTSVRRDIHDLGIDVMAEKFWRE